MSDQRPSVEWAMRIARSTTAEGDLRQLLTTMHNAAIVLAGELELRQINWRPIETVPTDRPSVIGRWRDGKWQYVRDYYPGQAIFGATHWAELEAPSDG